MQDWDGIERRGGRVVYSRGPIILILEALSALTAVAVIVALIISLTVFGSRLDLIQRSRAASATDTCYLFRHVIILAGDAQGKHNESIAFLRRSGLADCRAFGRNVTSLEK